MLTISLNSWKTLHWEFLSLSLQNKLSDKLESTDAAPEVPHLRPTRRDTGRGVQRGYQRVGPRLRFFFFFLRFAPTMRLDSCRIGFDSSRTGLIRPKSGRIGHIGSYRPAAHTANTAITGRKKVETGRHTGNGWNRPWIWPEKPKLAFFFLFLWIKA